MTAPVRDPLEELPDPFASELTTPPSGDPYRALEAEITRAPRPATRDAVRWRKLSLVVAVAGYELMFLAVMGTRDDLGTAPRVGLVVALVAPLVGAVLSVVAAARGGGRGLGVRALPMASLLGLTCVGWAAAASAHLAAEGLSLAASPAATARCFMGTTMLALVPFALALVAYRRAFVAGAAVRSLALGIAAGSVATAAMELRCGLGGAAHYLLGHGLPLALFALGGLAAARITRT